MTENSTRKIPVAEQWDAIRENLDRIKREEGRETPKADVVEQHKQGFYGI